MACCYICHLTAAVSHKDLQERLPRAPPPPMYPAAPLRDGQRLVFPVHPCFRFLALAEPPSQEHPWLTGDTMPTLSFLHVPSPTSQQLQRLLMQVHPAAPADVVRDLVAFAAAVRADAEGPGSPLSTAHVPSVRQLLRLTRRAVRADAHCPPLCAVA